MHGYMQEACAQVPAEEFNARIDEILLQIPLKSEYSLGIASSVASSSAAATPTTAQNPNPESTAFPSSPNGELNDTQGSSLSVDDERGLQVVRAEDIMHSAAEAVLSERTRTLVIYLCICLLVF